MKRRVITYFKIAFLLTLFALLCVNLSAQQQPSFKVLVVGGADNTGVFANTSEVFDSSTGTWTLSANNIPNAPPNTVGGLCAPNIAKVGNGKILLAGGGCTDFGFTTNAASLYDPTSSIWTATGTSAPNFMNYGRDQFGMVTIKGGNALAFDGCAGGCSGPNILGQFISTVGNSAEVYSYLSNTWTIVNPSLTTRGNLAFNNLNQDAVVLQDGRVLTCNGSDGFQTYNNSCEIYDPVGNNWAVTGSMPEVGDHRLLLLPSGEVLTVLNTGNLAFLFDPNSGTWTTTGSLGIPQIGGNLLLLSDGRVLYSGGTDTQGNPVNTVQIYDPATQQWFAASSMTTSRFDHIAVRLPDGRVLAAGGESSNLVVTASAEIYDPSTGLWTLTGPMNSPRLQAGALLLANPVPLINLPLVPDAVVAGTNGVTLTVNGSGFVANSVVMWNGTALPTTFVNFNQLTATVPASDIAVDGTASVTVTNPGPGGGTSNVVFFTTTTPTTNLSFSSSSISFGSSFPFDMLAADFNNDSKLDLAVTNVGTNAVDILLGNGDGTFQNQLASPTGSSPYGVAVGDFNGDGKLDLAAANVFGNSVSILLGNGDGTFQNQVAYATGLDPYGVAVGDFNGDGELDLAVPNYFGNSVSILLGNGNGTFQNQVAYATGSNPIGITLGDFNGDGKLDLVVTNSSAGTVSILLGNGDGTFQNQVVYTTAGTPHGVTVGDFNGDGKLDLATANVFGNSVSILLGNGDGTFQNQATYATGTEPEKVATGDFNGDGKLDLAVTNYFDNTISILLGNGDGTFQNQIVYATGLNPEGITVGDFNGDGRLDLVVANYQNNSVSILMQSPNISISPPSVNFGPQQVGTTSGPQTLTVTNTGTATLTISSITIGGLNAGDFAETDNCIGNSVAQTQSCTVQVTFTPTATGLLSANLSFTDNAPGSPQTVPLSGTGTSPGPVIISPPSLTFGSQLVNTTSTPQTLLVTNSGTAALTISAIATTGDFSQTNNCG
ncbi:MAG TPA: FG-GAP-like repeat-containing protein, partial [Terriglobales bacterium]